MSKERIAVVAAWDGEMRMLRGFEVDYYEKNMLPPGWHIVSWPKHLTLQSV